MITEKYGRTYHYPFSPGTTSDDRINHTYWEDIRRISTLVHTEKLDGENNCLSRWGVFARSHAAPMTFPWTSQLRERWELMRNDLGDVELFGENLYALHSIAYRRLETHFYVFGVRCRDMWLSWEEVRFYASLFDLPTVPVLRVEAVAGLDERSLSREVIRMAVHTRMVLEALGRSAAFDALPGLEKEILWTATLLHDVEKRSTSVDEGEGRISANGHARKGEYTARSILYRDVPVPFKIREQVAALVRYHGLPLWLMEKPDPVKKVCEASLRVDTSLLKILAGADIRGRICEDGEALLEALEYFEICCREQDCWGKPREFPTDSGRFCYFRTPDAIRRKHKLSPTDKSANGWVVQAAKEEARGYLRKGQDFIWNATNITRQMRERLVDLFTDYGAKVKIVYIEKPYAEWRHQNRNRAYALPEPVLDNMLDKLEIPLLTEAHEVTYRVAE